MRLLVLGLTVCIGCILPIISPAQTSLSLSDAVRIGLEQNHDIKISILKAKSVGEAHVSEMQANRLPSLKLFATYTRLSDIGQTAISVPLPGIPPIAFTTYFPNNYSVKLSLLQPVFTGFRLLNLQHVAEHFSAAAEADVKTDQGKVIFAIKQQYWTLFKLQKTLEAIEKSLTESNAHLSDVRSKLADGTALPSDTLKTQVQVSNNELRKIQTEKDIRVAMASLMNTLGLPLDEKVILASAPEENIPPLKPLYDILKEASINRSELTALDERVEAAKANIKVMRSPLFPQVTVGGNLYYANPNPRYFPAQDAFKTTWDASVNLSWELWTWNSTGLQVEQAEYVAGQLEETKKQLEDAISLEVTQNYLTEQTSLEQIRVAKLSVTQTEENLRVIKMQYTKGVATTTDVIGAETLEQQAEVNLATAIADANIVIAQLEKSVGK
ncbi:MAG: TolC family protein [Candidatus Kapaibacterium sp.]